jgi:thiamine biosynthesis protein ThiI
MMEYISLMSGGIDSPAATHMMLKKEAKVQILNMDNRPFGGDDELNKVDRIAQQLSKLHPGKVTLLRAKHGINLQSFFDHSNRKYMCILCKKAMLMVADIVCTERELDGIIMGDSMGQVASQTLPNMSAVSAGIKNHIIRPLIGLDKLDIEKIAKEAGTFDISIERTVGCTAAPKHPITHAVHKRLVEEAEKADYLQTIEEVAGSVHEISL